MLTTERNPFSLWLLALLLWLISGVRCQQNELTSSDPASCGDFSGLAVTNLEFTYYRVNSSLDYLLIANSQQPGLSPTLRIDVSIQGYSAAPQIIALCNGVTNCPLPQNQDVIINGQLMLNASYTANLPSYIWTAPDLAASATFQFYSSPGNFVACVHTGVSNGLTSKSAPVSWATGALAVAVIAAAGLAGVVGHTSGHGGDDHAKGAGDQDPSANISAPDPTSTGQAHAPTGGSHSPLARMDPLVLFFHFQFISITGLLSLNTPPIYQAFSTNFAWANFLIPLKPFQHAAAHMRKCTVAAPSISSLHIPPVDSGLTESASIPGIPRYASKLGIYKSDVFAISYLVFLCVCAIFLVISIVSTLVLLLLAHTAKSSEKKELWTRRRTRWHQMSSNNSLRIMYLAFGSLATLAFYQWTQKCTSAVTAFASAVSLAIIVGVLGLVTFLIILMATRPDGKTQLYTKSGTYARRWGALYNVLHHDRVIFLVPLLGLVLARSAIVGFGQGSGIIQVIALIVLETVTASVLFWYRPYFSPGYNRVNYLIAGTKIVTYVLLLPFSPKYDQRPGAAYILGMVLLIINSIVGVILFVLTVLKLGWGILWFRKKHVALESRKSRSKRSREPDVRSLPTSFQAEPLRLDDAVTPTHPIWQSTGAPLPSPENDYMPRASEVRPTSEDSQYSAMQPLYPGGGDRSPDSPLPFGAQPAVGASDADRFTYDRLMQEVTMYSQPPQRPEHARYDSV